MSGPPVDPFADLATLAHKISRKLAVNPGDTQARDDLRYVVGKMGPAAQTAAGQDQAAIPRDVGPLGTFVQNAGNSASMGAGNALAASDNPELGKVIEASNAANPVSAKLGSAAGVIGPIVAGDWAAGWPMIRAIAKVPQLGARGALRLLAAAAKASPEAAPQAEKAAAQIIKEAAPEEIPHLNAVKKALFGNKALTQEEESTVLKVAKQANAKPMEVVPESSSGVNIAKPVDEAAQLLESTPDPADLAARSRIFRKQGFSESDAMDMARQGTKVPRKQLERLLGKRLPGTHEWI